MADTRRLNHPPLPPGARKAGWLRLFASLSKHLRLFRSSTLLPARPRTRAREPSRRWDVAQIGGRAGKVRGTNAARVSNDSAAKQPLPAPHGRRGGAATPSSNILNFFFPRTPSSCCSRGCDSNDPRLSRKGFRNGVAAVVCRYAIFYFLFFFTRFCGERWRIDFQFFFFLSVETGRLRTGNVI